MAGYYDSDILRVIRAADRPLLMREIVDQIAPNDYTAFSNIGNALTHLYRQGRIARQKPERWFVYTCATQGTEAPEDIACRIAYGHDEVGGYASHEQKEKA
jgi:predicted transcriptional regulator